MIGFCDDLEHAASRPAWCANAVSQRGQVEGWGGRSAAATLICMTVRVLGP